MCRPALRPAQRGGGGMIHTRRLARRSPQHVGSDAHACADQHSTPAQHGGGVGHHAHAQTGTPPRSARWECFQRMRRSALRARCGQASLQILELSQCRVLFLELHPMSSSYLELPQIPALFFHLREHTGFCLSFPLPHEAQASLRLGCFHFSLRNGGLVLPDAPCWKRTFQIRFLVVLSRRTNSTPVAPS